jgi:hypothetical protein
MGTTLPSETQTLQRGARIYEERLRQLLEPAHNGEYVVIDVETGEYEVDADHLAASDRAAAKHPGAPLYATRVGSSSLGQIGGRLTAARS